MEDSEDGLAIKNGEQFNETFIAVLFENSEKFEIHETPDGTFIHTNDVAAELKLAKIMETNFPDSLDDVEDLWADDETTDWILWCRIFFETAIGNKALEQVRLLLPILTTHFL